MVEVLINLHTDFPSFTGIIFSSFPTTFIISVTLCLLATPFLSFFSFIPDSAWWWYMAGRPGIHSNGHRLQSSPPEWCGWTDRSASGCSSHRRCHPGQSNGLGCTRHFSGPGRSCCRLQGRVGVGFILLGAYDSTKTPGARQSPTNWLKRNYLLLGKKKQNNSDRWIIRSSKLFESPQAKPRETDLRDRKLSKAWAYMSQLSVFWML